MSKQLKNYYYNSITKHLDYELYDLLLNNVNGILFDYSDHHLSNKITFKKKIKKIVKNYFFWFLYLKNISFKKYDKKKIIISSSYVDLCVENSIVVSPPWIFSQNAFCSWKLILIIRRINDKIQRKSIKVLFSPEFKILIDNFQDEFSFLLNKYKVNALVFPNDLAFFENLSIKIAKMINIPSIVYLHGMPARYNSIDDNRGEYLIVWGKGFKDLYVKNGVDEKKILTSKHPVYSEFKKTNLKSNLTNVLVLTKATCGVPSSSSELILSNDRSTVLYYIELVKNNLKKMGVEKATLRLHPSEDPSFYSENWIDEFYDIDNLSKEESLAKASLVIGPTSTMLLDSIKKNTNYILFDPVEDGKTLGGMPLVEPFTGESFIKLSNDLEEMIYNIKNPNDNIDFEKLNNFLEVNPDDEIRITKILSNN
ncbi:hypothetical protein [Flavobacterium gelatinilyticum]|uniref:hypothetical protein n=1 Tax=Flavobacterium gelatinilyticum TaxID=3003260 RepID=UPI00247FBA4C|nr:hypothetical protein [Flavobacterium gelatinilyticum]